MARLGPGRSVRRIGERACAVVLRAEAGRGAGAVWDDRTSSMLWIDQTAGRLHRLDPSDHADVVCARVEGEMVAAAPFADGSGFVAAAPDHVARIGPDGSVKRRLALPHGMAGSPVTVAACDRAGRFWLAAGPSMTRVETNGSFGDVIDVIDVPPDPSGMGWSADAATLFLAAGLELHACPFDLATGEVGESRTVVIIETAARGASLGGLAVDVAGCVWVTVRGAGELRRYTPDGRLDTVVEVPVSQVTDCAFAGPGSRDLYVTTATDGLDPKGRRKELLAGAVFCVDVGIAGVAARPFGAPRG